MLKKLKHIQTKIVFIMFFLITFILIVLTIITFFYLNNIFKKQIMNDNQILLERYKFQIESDLEEMEDYVGTVAYASNIQDLVKKYYTLESEDIYSYYSLINSIETLLSNYTILNKKMIYSLYIIDEDGSQTLTVNDIYTNIQEQEWYKVSMKNKLESAYSIPYKSQDNTKSSIISYFNKFYSVDDPEFSMGIIVAELLYEKYFFSIFNESNEYKDYYIINNYDDVLFSNNKISDSSLNFRYSDFHTNLFLKDKENFYLSTPVNKLNSVLVSVVPINIYKDYLKNLLFIIFVTFALSLIGGFVLIIPLSNSIANPIIKLTNAIKQCSTSNFFIPITIDQQDEILELTNAYNYMIKEKNRLIKEEKEMQINLFINKINPHFIYNTLNCVIHLARKSNSYEIVKLTKSFINILRRNIAISDRKILISDVIEHINNYIEVLKYQYSDIINLRFDVEEGIDKLKIPPMILYPIVENSVFHGIVPKMEKGNILIKIGRNKDMLEIIVSDDGVGMEEDKVIKINKYLCDELNTNTDGHIGLKSVYERIIFFYGKDSIFDIHSEINFGTQIIIKFNINKSDYLC
jgi:two-component system sensor histidine kinase YesM